MTTASSRSPKPTAPRGHDDAISLLLADHREVKAMFKQFEALKESGSSRDKQQLVQRLCAALTIHAQLEEELFYPAVREAIDDDDLMDEADVEHASAKVLIAQLERSHPDDELYDARVTVLGEQIDHHVKEEETQMFPRAKKAVDTAALFVSMQARKKELERSPAHARPLPPTDVRPSAPM
jgi:hemerythrin superfamily protein